MQYLRLLLLPFSVLYGLIIWLRNKAYDSGVFSSKKFNIPVICIGNLAVGGAGKSPMAEYIIRLLNERHKVAVLSRGYGRKTKGFRLVGQTDTTLEAGDEPMQFRRKFKDITVAVSEKRVIGLNILQKNHEVVVLDDAFQHRAVDPGLSILLFDYTRLDEFLLMLPAGNLREPFSGRKRANIIVITKTPDNLDQQEKDRIINRLRPCNNQQVFFSYLEYGGLVPVYDVQPEAVQALHKDTLVFLLTGIANPYPLVEKLKNTSKNVKHYDYPDHHPFSKKNILKLVSDFKEASGKDKIIITTEKDAQRLQLPELKELLAKQPVYYLPVMAKIHEPDVMRFNEMIERYATKHI
ncbi:tetraacyldisaccharide 4'-kinase [Desertivirga xinjiangensis]|uniref:tetraacyldisaccharide 4'-kinase n=1 Tax=Desertivirga xinjiangensis TaxID=539206 RepID=UPI00210AF4BE|nr:tetraacyldisaccharide 4'-kinase [Pedobacter xinjiangensis]